MNSTNSGTGAGNPITPPFNPPATNNRNPSHQLPSTGNTGGNKDLSAREKRRAVKKNSRKVKIVTGGKPRLSAEAVRRQAVHEIRAQHERLKKLAPVDALDKASGIAEGNADVAPVSQSTVEYGSKLIRCATHYGTELAKLSWRWGCRAADAMLPAFPGAMAASPDDVITQTEIAIERCNARADQSGNCLPSQVGVLLADLKNEFIVHISPSLAKRDDQSLANVMILIAYTDEFSAQIQRDLRTVLEKHVKPGDLLLTAQPAPKPNVPACQEILTSIRGMEWIEMQPPAPQGPLDEAKKKSDRLLMTVLELVHPALSTKFPSIGEMRQMASSDLRKMYVNAIRYLNKGFWSKLNKPVSEIRPYVDECENAYAAFREKQRTEDVTRISRIATKLTDTASHNRTKFVLLEEQYVLSLASSSLFSENAIVVTHKNRPLSIGRTVHDKHPFLINYLENSLKAEYSLEFSPSLAHRADRSLAGVTILIADTNHNSEDTQKRIADIIDKFRVSGDILLREKAEDVELTSDDCLGKKKNCFAIDDADIRKPADLFYKESNVFLYETFDILRAAGIQGIPSNRELSRLRLTNEIEPTLEIFLADVKLDRAKDAKVRASYSEHLRVYTKFLEQITITIKARDRNFFKKLSTHASGSVATFAVLGALHVANLRERVLSELDAIVIWPKGWTLPDVALQLDPVDGY
ncbi:MAG: hypothetical protein JWQ23_1768 [Herminiimonas sp.]|nr:hypothetical protein [Herminiimonas sp.]